MDARNPRRDIAIGISALTIKPISNAARLADQYPIRHPPDHRLLDRNYWTKEVIGHAGTWLMVLAIRQDLDTHCSRAENAHLFLGQNAVVPWLSLERMTTDTLFAVTDRAAAAVPPSAAGCRRRDVSG
jgi:hypothetical protein